MDRDTVFIRRPSYGRRWALSIRGKLGDTHNKYSAGPMGILVEDDESDKDLNLFLILCDEKLERLYALMFAEVAEDCSIEFRFASNPESFMLQCLRNPPTAGLIDLASLIRGKTEEMNRLFAFRSVWPVLRSRIGSDGTSEIMRMNPPLKGSFEQTIADLVEGGSAWENTVESRMFLRSPARCRARVRDAGSDDDWKRVNIEVISRGGCLLVASDLAATGTRLELEIRDLPGCDAILSAEVAWSQTWEDGPEIPKCGLKFDQESFPESLLEALSNPNFVTVF